MATFVLFSARDGKGTYHLGTYHKGTYHFKNGREAHAVQSRPEKAGKLQMMSVIYGRRSHHSPPAARNVYSPQANFSSYDPYGRYLSYD